MNKKDLINELKLRIDKTRFSDGFKGELLNSHLIKGMSIDLLNNLIFLKDYDFNLYLTFLLKFSKVKKGFIDYEEKLNLISNYLLLNIGTFNATQLMNLLIDTDLILNSTIKKFTSNFLDIKDISKVDAIIDILYSLDGKLSHLNLGQILGIVKRVNNPDVLFEIVHLFEKEIIKEDKNLTNYLNLIDDNLDNYNIMFFIRVLYIREFRNLPNVIKILSKYILNINNSNVNIEDITSKNELFLLIFKNLDMLESFYLEKIIDFVNSCDTSYYEIIRKLVTNKNLFKDRNFYILFNSLKDANSKERDFILAILNNQSIINNEIQIKAVLEYLKNAKEESKLIAFYKLFIVGPLKNESLYTDFSMFVKDSLLKSKTNEQLKTLVDICPLIKNSLYQREIIRIILNTNNKYALEVIREIFKISYVKENMKVIDLMRGLQYLQDESQELLVRKLIMSEKLFKNNKFKTLIDEVLKKKNIKILYALDYIDLFKENYNDIFFQFFDLVINITSSSQYKFLTYILKFKKLLNNKNIEIIKEFIYNTHEDYKFKYFGEYIRNNYSKDENFSLDTDRSKTIIMLIEECRKEFQVETLIKVSKLVKGSKEEANLLVKAIHVDNLEQSNYLVLLLEIPNIINNSKFKEILYHYETCDNRMQKDSMLELLNIEGIMESEYLIGYLMIIKRLITIEQIDTLLGILREYSDLKDYELFTFCKRIMFITDSIKLILVSEIILISKTMPYELTDLVIEKIELSDKENIIEIVQYVDYLITKYNGQESIVIENLMKELNFNKVLKK